MSSPSPPTTKDTTPQNNNNDTFKTLQQQAQNLKLDSDNCQICMMQKEPHDDPQPAKYRCPACQLLFCSLNCSKKHKELFSCDGKRDATKFVSLPQFNHSMLTSDFRFLEEQKNRQIHMSTFRESKRMREPQDYRISKKELFLIARARDKQCFLKILAHGMKRRMENRTHFINGKEVFIWNVRFFFDYDLRRFGGEQENQDASDQTASPLILKANLNETLTVKEGFKGLVSNLSAVHRQELELYLKLWEEEASGDDAEKDTAVPSEQAETGDTTTTDQKEPDSKDASSGLSFLLRMESVQKPGKWFLLLDPNTSIVDSLKRRVIVEQPDIHVVTAQRLSNYRLLSSEEAAQLYDSEVNNFKERRRKRIQHRERVERYDRKTGDGSNIVDWNEVFDTQDDSKSTQKNAKDTSDSQPPVKRQRLNEKKEDNAK